jgi:hypothetical protein
MQCVCSRGKASRASFNVAISRSSSPSQGSRHNPVRVTWRVDVTTQTEHMREGPTMVSFTVGTPFLVKESPAEWER